MSFTSETLPMFRPAMRKMEIRGHGTVVVMDITEAHAPVIAAFANVLTGLGVIDGWRWCDKWDAR